jgi:hypothetical protein
MGFASESPTRELAGLLLLLLCVQRMMVERMMAERMMVERMMVERMVQWRAAGE